MPNRWAHGCVVLLDGCTKGRLLGELSSGEGAEGRGRAGQCRKAVAACAEINTKTNLPSMPLDIASMNSRLLIASGWNPVCATGSRTEAW